MIRQKILAELAANPAITANEHQRFLFNDEPDVLSLVPGLKCIGNMPRRKSLDIRHSPLGIGFETMDRDTFTPADTFAPLGASGVKYARCQTGWMKCEKIKGRYDFAWLDEIVDNLAKVGVETWFSLSFGNPLYTPCPEYEKQTAEAKKNGTPLPGRPRGWVGEVPYLHGADAMTGWLNYVKALCSHFKGRVTKFEVWNEPEANCFWQCRGEKSTATYHERARQYTDFVRITGQAVKSVIPEAEIIGVAAKPGTEYIHGLGKAGLADVIDLFSFHDYGPVPEIHLSKCVEHLRANLRRSDGKPLRIIQGESGRATGKSAHFAFPTQLGQAKFIARRYLIDFLLGAEITSYFTVTDFLCYYADGSDQYYGVLDARHKTPKLAYHTMSCLAWLFDGLERAPEMIARTMPLSPFHVNSWLPFSGITGAFRRHGVPVFAMWVPEHVELSMPAAFEQVLCSTGEERPFRDPVILDPVHGKVWDASAIHSPVSPTWNTLYGSMFRPFPVTNYPLIITEAEIFSR